MPSSSSEKSLQTSKEDKFFSRLLSKESSAANPSFRVYYGVASGAVPFRWESHPGTPKNPVTDVALIPPLTPPPSYYSHPKSSKASKKHSTTTSRLMHALLPRLALMTRPPPPVHRPSPSSPSVSSSSSSSNSFSPMEMASHQRTWSSFSVSRGEDEEESEDGSPTSTLCFRRTRHGAAAMGGWK